MLNTQIQPIENRRCVHIQIKGCHGKSRYKHGYQILTYVGNEMLLYIFFKEISKGNENWMDIYAISVEAYLCYYTDTF